VCGRKWIIETHRETCEYVVEQATQHDDGKITIRAVRMYPIGSKCFIVLIGTILRGSRRAVNQIKALPEVLSVTRDKTVRGEEVQWNLDRIDSPNRDFVDYDPKLMFLRERRTGSWKWSEGEKEMIRLHLRLHHLQLHPPPTPSPTMAAPSASPATTCAFDLADGDSVTLEMPEKYDLVFGEWIGEHSNDTRRAKNWACGFKFGLKPALDPTPAKTIRSFSARQLS